MEIMAIIVLYRENLYNTLTYKSLLANSNFRLFIYDNSPEPMHLKSEFNDSYTYYHDESNKGLSVAYNMAAKYAQNRGYKWILLLDQDTSFVIDAKDKYIEMFEAHPEVKLFAPNLKLKDDSWFSPILEDKPRKNGLYMFPGVYDINKYRLVNSGLLINIEAFWKVGGYNDKVRLDFADFEFVKRFRKFYDKFAIISTVAIQDFSSHETNVNKLIFRFKLYCESAKMCSKNSLYEEMNMFYTVFRRMCGLVIKTKKMDFIKIFYQNYL